MRELARVVALGLAALLLAYPFTVTEANASMTAITVPAALLVLNALVLWSDGAVTLAAVALGAQYAAALFITDGDFDLLSPAVAILLLAFVEVCDIAIATPARSALDLPFLRRTAWALGGSAVLALAAAAFVVAAAATPLPDNQLVRSLGVGAAGLAVAAPLLLFREG